VGAPLIHIITPTNRWPYLRYLKSNLERMSHSIGSLIEWHILLAEEDYRNIGKFVEDYLQPSSLSDIEVFRCAALPPGDMCYLKINHWLDCHDIKSDDWYLVLADDNMVGPGALEALQNIPTTIRVAIFSCLRGQRQVDHPCSTLIARPDSIGICRTDLSQFVLRGSVYQCNRFHPGLPGGVSDGELIGRVHKEYSTAYFPEIFMHFNVLQPGRWDAEAFRHLF
jgi:hypothetical protein